MISLFNRAILPFLFKLGKITSLLRIVQVPEIVDARIRCSRFQLLSALFLAGLTLLISRTGCFIVVMSLLSPFSAGDPTY